MAAEGGRVTFARFMELALTHPTDGYYSRARRLLGPRGDFTTAPRISPAFNGAVGRLLEELIDGALASSGGPEGDHATLVELGAGEADLAKALLARWTRGRPDLRGRLGYVIVEVGGALRGRQLRRLAKFRDEGWDVRWARSPEEAMTGTGATIFVGNEFVDALPVHLVDVRGPVPLEAWVRLEGAEAGVAAREEWDALSTEAATELEELFGTADAEVLREVTQDGVVELRPAAGRLLRQAASRGSSACVLTVDYGEWFATLATAGHECPDPEPVSAPLGRRSVRGYFKHELVTDPYVRVGRQDLTADVDFRALDHHGRRLGFETVLYTTLSGLLRADGADHQLEKLQIAAARPTQRALQSDRQASVLEKLLDERGLGGVFKVMLQVREARTRRNRPPRSVEVRDSR